MFIFLFRAVIGLTKPLVSNLFLQAALKVNFFLLVAEFPWQIWLLCSIRSPVYDPAHMVEIQKSPKVTSKVFKQTLHYMEDPRCLGPFYLCLPVGRGLRDECHSVFIWGGTSLTANKWGGYISCMIYLRYLNFMLSTLVCFLWNTLITS